MPNNNLHTEIRSKVDSFVSEISDMLRTAALGSVSMALGVEELPRQRTARRGPGRPPAAKVGGPRGKRSSQDVEALGQKVLSHVRSNPGQRLEEIGRALKRDTSGLKLPVSKLMAAKKLKTTGQKRGTKYFVR